MNKYEELKERIKSEIEWGLESLEDKYYGTNVIVPKLEDLTLTNFIGSDFSKKISDFDRGILFGYLSILSECTFLDEN